MAELVRVLFVEDSEDDCFLVQRALARAGLDIEWQRVDEREAFLQAVAGPPWDIVLCDHSMPQFASLQALTLLRERGLDIPFVIVSGTIGEEQAVAAMKAGASDYVLKGNLTRLPEVITRERREHAQRAARRDAERALGEAEAQLQHAQKMEAVGRLAGGIAHDFNNLLTAILGFSELALDDLSVNAPLRHNLDQIVLAAERAARLTKQLLAFCRRDPSRPTRLDVGETIGALTPMVQRLLGADITVTHLCHPDARPVMFDQGQLEQIVMNLAVNARDAMPDGGALTMTTEPATIGRGQAASLDIPPGPYTAVTVHDNGHGMDAATRARVFDPFFTTKAPGKGTGLGLSTVYGLIRQCGGAIALESAPGQGTTFRLLIPVATAETMSPAAPSATRAAATGTETLLLVENDAQVRRLALAVLGSAGYTVLDAADRAEALTVAAAASRVDLLLTNVIMPGGTGRDLARQIRTRHGSLRVLYLSGYTTHDALPDHVAADPLGMLRKPFSPSSLLAAVRACLDAAAKEPL